MLAAQFALYTIWHHDFCFRLSSSKIAGSHSFLDEHCLFMDGLPVYPLKILRWWCSIAAVKLPEGTSWLIASYHSTRCPIFHSHVTEGSTFVILCCCGPALHIQHLQISSNFGTKVDCWLGRLLQPPDLSAGWAGRMVGTIWLLV